VDDEGDGDGDKDEAAVAKSSVASSLISIFLAEALPAGAPQAEQKRPLAGTSVPQDAQEDIKFSRYSLTRCSAACDFTSVLPSK